MPQPLMFFNEKPKEGLKAKITAWVAKVTKSEPQGETPLDTDSGFISPESAYYQDVMEGADDKSRRAGYRDYDTIESEMPLVPVALTSHSDSATMSEEGDVTSIQFHSDDPDLERLWDDMDDRIGLMNHMWSVDYEALQMGDLFNEIVVNSMNIITRIKRLPPDSMFRNEDGKGNLRVDAYLQKDPTTNEVLARFADWEIVHVRHDAKMDAPYGRSMLFATRRLYRHIQMMSESIVIQRLLRASNRLAFMPEAGRMTEKAMRRYLHDLRRINKTQRLIDPKTGHITERYNPIGSQEDLYLLLRDGKGDIKTLQGQSSMDIPDYLQFFKEWLASLKTPLAYLGLDESTRGKAVLGQEDIQYSRSIRREQSLISWWARTIFSLQYLLLFDQVLPDSAYTLEFPAVSASDDAVRWGIEETKATIAKTMKVEVGAVDNFWIYTELLGMNDQEARAMMVRMGELISPDDPRYTTATEREKMPTSAQVFKNRELVKSINNLREIIYYEDKPNVL
ncbi:MAG: portal protein [Candidatus Nealsonbacteria bacterium]|nr:portal protein [Candidatus Nealsonbacteria bacterium]